MVKKLIELKQGINASRIYGWALLSHRYGSRPIPTTIPEHEMDAMMKCLQSESDNMEDIALIDKWYKLDENKMPNEYILQSLVDKSEIEKFLHESEAKSLIPEELRQSLLAGLQDEQLDVYFNNPDSDKMFTYMLSENYPVSEEETAKNLEKERELFARYGELVNKGKKAWQQEEPILAGILRRVVKTAAESNLMDKDTADKYFQSVTEEEVVKGIVEDPLNSERCLVFLRDIDNINTSHNKAWRFIDMQDDEVDSESEARLNHLKSKIVPSHLPAENIFRFSTTWTDDGGINEKDNDDYLRRFCESFEKSVWELIEKGVQNRKSSDKLSEEIIKHSQQVVKRVAMFHGREEVLKKVEGYVMSSNNQPLVIHGESGSGKTSVLAKAAMQMPVWCGDSANLTICIRFLGTTPQSSNIHHTLQSIAGQIISACDIADQFPEVPEDYNQMVHFFKLLISSVPDNNKLVVFLDSLDQLLVQGNAHKLHWLPKVLPSNVKFIVSTVPIEHNILQTLQSGQLGLSTDQFVVVDTMEIEVCIGILNKWLHDRSRKLSAVQEDMIKNLITNKVKPLYLKLVFDEISKWKSYEEPIYKCKTVHSCLQRMFRKLEAKHGLKIIRSALGYLCMSTNGLTENEMEDILSIDDEVMNDIFEFHIPPIRRLPSILWARIRSDISEYIVDRYAHGVNVFLWYHRQFSRAANARYIPGTSLFGFTKGDIKETVPMYKNLSEYFSGVWGGDKPKPFEYTEKQKKKLGLSSIHSEEIRYVSNDPTLSSNSVYSMKDCHFKYNMRRIGELPAACLVVNKWEDYTKFIAEHIALNPDFLSGWITSSGWQEIHDYFTAISTGSPHCGEAAQMKKSIMKIKRTKHNQSAVDLNLPGEPEINWNEFKSGTSGLILQISAMHNCLLMSYTTLIKNPTFIGSFLTGRMIHYNTTVDGISEWVRFTDTQAGRRHCALVPPHLQLEVPGDELLAFANHHTGPIANACWSETDNKLCLSASQQFVAVQYDTGNIVINTRPKGVPEGDSFTHVLSAQTTGDQASNQTDKIPVYFASLKQHPWVYVFDADGEVVNILDFSGNREPSTYVISKLRWLKYQQKLYLIALGSNMKFAKMAVDVLGAHPSIISFPSQESESPILDIVTQYRKAEKSEFYADAASEDKSDDEAESETKPPKSEEFAIICPKILVIRKNGSCTLLDVNLSILDEKQMNWCSEISSYTSSNNRSKLRSIVAFEDGKLCLLKWNPYDEDLKSFHALYLIGSGRNWLYGAAHYVHHNEMVNTQKYCDESVGLACTGTHLLAFAETAFVLQSNRFKKEIKEARANPELKLISCMRKKYDLAVYSTLMRFILAASGVTLDIFKLGELNDVGDDMVLDVRYYYTIEAHGQDITRILPTEEDSILMTFSKDSTWKIFQVTKAAMSYDYIPGFQRTEAGVDTIICGEHIALTHSTDSRKIHIWSLITGRILDILEDVNDSAFEKFILNEDQNIIVTLSKNGVCAFWKIDRNSVIDGAKTTFEPVLISEPLSSCYGDNSNDYARDSKFVFSTMNNQAVIATSGSKTKLVLITMDTNTSRVSEESISWIKHAIQYKTNKFVFVSENQVLVSELKSGDELSSEIHDIKNFLQCNQTPKDVKLLQRNDAVCFIMGTFIVVWNPDSKTVNKVSVFEDDIMTSELKFYSGSSSDQCIVYETGSNQYGLLNYKDNLVSQFVKFTDNPESIKTINVTNDGKYMICTSTNRHDIYLIRISDGKLLAWYTILEEIDGISISANSWYVVIRTLDRRLFVLLIADPDDASHDDRIAFVRGNNATLTKEHTLMLISETCDLDDAVSTVNVNSLEECHAYWREVSRRTLQECYDRIQKANELGLIKPVEVFYGNSMQHSVSVENSELYSTVPCVIQ